MPEDSVNPSGEKFPLPDEAEYAAEMARLEKLARRRRAARARRSSWSWASASSAR